MTSLNQWTWVWVNSGSWWWTGRPGVLQSMGSQRVGYNWVTELNWTEFSLTIKKAEHQRIDAFQLWCWRRLLGVPWTTRRSNQSILKETSPEYSLEVLMLNLKLWFIYFGPVMWRTNWLEKNWLQCGVLQSKSWLWLSNWTELNFPWRLLNSGVI